MSARDLLSELPGQIVDGKYRVETLLGRGGMGAVFRASKRHSEVVSRHRDGAEHVVRRVSRSTRRHQGERGGADRLVASRRGVFLLFMTINSVFASLMYLSARRATGESMEQILDDLEASRER